MTFVHPLILGGLALLAVPVLIHLLMKQTPRRLRFSAFQFLLERQKSNQRRVRLRHLLLLLLRCAVLAALALALARPRVPAFGWLAALADTRPVDAVLVLDTSLSMTYADAGRSWFDEARTLAGQLLDQLPEGSRIAVFDTAEPGGEWLASRALARQRLESRQPAAVNGTVTRALEQAFRLFEAESAEGQADRDDAAPRQVYIFSDRTRASWDDASASSLKKPDDVAVVFVDVGRDDARDAAIVEVRPERTTFWPGERIKVHVTVQASGADFEGEILGRFDRDTRDPANGAASGAAGAAESQRVLVPAGQSRVVTFERAAAGVSEAATTGSLREGFHQVEVRLSRDDALAFNNQGFATFRIQEGHRVLILSDLPADAAGWARALGFAFRTDARTVAEAAATDLGAYQVVILAGVAAPGPALWDRLRSFVTAGGGLAIVPGGEGWSPDPTGFAGAAADALLPARFAARFPERVPTGLFWRELDLDPQRLRRSPFLASFAAWKDAGDVDFLTDASLRPRVTAFWKVQPAEGSEAVATYTDGSPAVVQRTVGRGRVLMLTTSFDRRRDAQGREWNNYFELSSFGFVLANLTASQLAGGRDEPTLTHVVGQAVTVALPARPFFPGYSLLGPGITGNEGELPRQADQKELRLPPIRTPGNFRLLDGDRNPVAAFSANARREESTLERVPVDALETVLGPGSVVPADGIDRVRDQAQKDWTRPIELLPLLLVLLLLALAVENLLANRFYRQPAQEPTS